jgi:oligopeptidase A
LLLGYRSHAERCRSVPKMARTPGEVLGFLRDLAKRARSFAVRDAAELREFAVPEARDLRARTPGGTYAYASKG